METAETAVKKALRMGATEAEAYVQRRKKIEIMGSDKVESFNVVESLGIGLRVVLGKRIAMYSTSILDEEEIDAAVARAVKIAKVSPEDPAWKHMNQRFGEASAEGCFDGNLETLDYRDMVEKVDSAINVMKSRDKRAKPTQIYLATAIQDISVANSCGESCGRRETFAATGMSVKAKEAGAESVGYESHEARFWKEINIEDLAGRAAEKAVKFLRAEPISSGKMPVIIKNKVFARIFGGLLSGPINADWVQKGRSPLSDKLGDQIASENVTVADDGLMAGGWATKPFDDEGHPTQRTPIVERAVLRNFLYDNYTALKDDVDSTGNAQRGNYSAAPQPAPNNLILEPGEASPEEMIRETRQGIYVEEVIGEWMSNPVSGSLTATVTHGYLVENGELTKPVKGIVVSGNFYELLRGGMELGNDLRNSYHYYSPTVKLAQLTIAGK